MTDAKKFMFDTHDFNKTKPGAAVVYSEEQLLLAKEQSFAQGKAEGLAEAKQQQEERIATLLQKALALAESLAAAESRREVEKCADAMSLALRVVRKLMPKFAAQYALPEIESVIGKSLETRTDEARIAVIIPAAHLENLKARVDALAASKGFAGKVILLADDNMAPTDCRVEWADGGAERLYDRLFAQIEGEFSRAISGIATSIEQTGQQ